MNPEYGNALYLLPFDHRHPYVTGMFGFEPPLTQALAGGVVRNTERVA